VLFQDEGYGAKDFYNVDPLLGTDEDWAALVDAAHALDLKIIADFNPSYFWTGAPAFQQARFFLPQKLSPPSILITPLPLFTGAN
jgi:glycosidase